MTTTPSFTTEIRERHVLVVLQSLLGSGAASRADIAKRTGLSKPTVGVALRILGNQGLVREAGRTSGNRGPRAGLYTVDLRSVTTLGLDIGARYLRATVADIEGTPLQEETVALGQPDLDHLLAAISELAIRISPLRSAVRLIVAGVPGVVDTNTGIVRSAPNILGIEGRGIGHLISERLGAPALIENDVNLAAIGERDYGQARPATSFCYLLVGTGLGSGIVLNGELYRGAHGAAGEVAFLPLGGDPFLAGQPQSRRGAMESRLSAAAIVAKAVELHATTTTRLTEPYNPAALFDAALSDDPLGKAVTAYAAREIALCIASIMAVVDLELILLGGGIGANSQFLLGAVREGLAQLVPFPPSVTVASLGDRSVQLGAISLGLATTIPAVVHDGVASDVDGPEE